MPLSKSPSTLFGGDFGRVVGSAAGGAVAMDAACIRMNFGS